MRMRSALTASVLAAGILLGGAGAALANGGVEGEYFDGGASRFASTCSSAAAVPARFGPAYTSSCAAEGEREWAEFARLSAGR
ncbi:hypothetical protein AB0P12_16135 [Streptomyces subrutilus]|uniref:Uncharacterized protein n=1 Tax=Streptomyces subrutilus TaxID=36818 RepID=A0A918QWU3_9ACTN|nr:hypothetical protein [Streptomyces subrutilus]WSJ28142.1 hypothetical protein OG479_01885 [Streptomyces subrutilus]GGZ70588.1 hypothetical protein GCM10010371_33190 [Streptomyces subrutilus]